MNQAPDNMSQIQGMQAIPKKIVNCDQEVWLKDRIGTAIRMALKVYREACVRADDPILDSAMEGIVNGTVVSVIREMGMEPEWVNLRNPNGIEAPRSFIGGLGEVPQNKP